MLIFQDVLFVIKSIRTLSIFDFDESFDSLERRTEAIHLYTLDTINDKELKSCIYVFVSWYLTGVD